MKRRSSIALLAGVTFLLLSGVGLLATDALIAANNMDPMPAASAVIEAAGWDTDRLGLKSYSGSGNAAVVDFQVLGTDEPQLVEVHLRRPFLRADWRFVKIYAE